MQEMYPGGHGGAKKYFLANYIYVILYSVKNSMLRKVRDAKRLVIKQIDKNATSVATSENYTSYTFYSLDN